VLLLVSRFPFPLPLSFRFASSLSTVAPFALLVQTHTDITNHPPLGDMTAI
jgi:hypothetical protein